ncbi:hypothetical protein [Dyella sp. C9]|uniref:hypothetical protein n=1 Tax=Dyella sp. C9 TaxID=2202154 RepID=UPI000DEF190B|nr:hypothetical protein [Dyella sp. C9]
MKTIPRPLSYSQRLRSLGVVVAALVFLVAVARLLAGAGEDVGLWRGLALSSLYIGFCLTQRRLFTRAPPAARVRTRLRMPR